MCSNYVFILLAEIMATDNKVAYDAKHILIR